MEIKSVGWQSSVVLVVLAFAILFALLDTSHQLNYAIPHDPQIIPTEPLVSQATVIEIVEREYRERVQHYQEAYLHVQYYNYSEGMEEDEKYQQYLLSLVPGWKLSYVKSQADLLSLPLVFVHANGTLYRVDAHDKTFEKICDRPSAECPLGRYAESARDRLVYEIGALIEAEAANQDIHHIVDAETGKVVVSSPLIEDRPVIPRSALENQRTIRQLDELIKNPMNRVSVEIVQNASDIGGPRKNGYSPAQVFETLYNATAIIWFNNDTVTHTVTSDNAYVDLLGRDFDSGEINPWHSFEFAFIEPGYVPYHCEIHPWIRGEVHLIENYA